MKPIISSLLDLDFYKISMANMIYMKDHSDVHVKYAFKNRSSEVDLYNWLDVNELEKQIEYTQNLKFTDEELKYLWDQGPFSFEFLEVLRNIELPTPKIIKKNDRFDGIEIEGRWIDAIWWETYLLSMVNQIVNAKHMKHLASTYDLFNDGMMLKGVSNLENKIEALQMIPGINFMEFGTRRRFSGDWQDYVIRRLKQEISGQLLGTSNVFYAKKYGLKPLGTMAHELFMVYAALYNDDLVAAQNALLDDWWDIYGEPLSIALIDTFGTDFFFKNFPMEHAINWCGVRQDSGDPFEIGEKVIKYYNDMGIDPSGKMIVFSDGLDFQKMAALYVYFSPKISVGFGWGTNLTSDIGNRTLSIVIKAVEANGKGLVKLSDNVAKAIGKPEDIERYKKTANYTVEFEEKCTY